MKKGDKAKLKPHTVDGVIVSVRYDEDTDSKSALLEYTEDGVKHQRWFDERELIVEEVQS